MKQTTTWELSVRHQRSLSSLTARSGKLEKKQGGGRWRFPQSETGKERRTYALTGKVSGYFPVEFEWSEFECGRTDLAEHTIDTTDARPIKQRHRLPQAVKEEIDRQIDCSLK